MLNNRKKTILTLLLIVFISFNIFVFSVNSVKAQLLVSSPDLVAIEIQKKVKKTVGASIMQSLTLMLVQTVNGVVQSLARDAAVWVSSGGKGQTPLFDGRTLVNYVRDSAITGVRDTVQDMFKTASGGYLSIDLCAPKLPSLLIKLQLGLLVGVSETITPPDCTWNKLSDNWDTFSRSMESGAFLKQVGVMFEPNQSQLGVALEVNGRTIAAKKTAEEQAVIDRLTNKGWKGVSSIVTGKISTPSDVVRESFGKSYFDHPEQQQIASFSAFGDAIASGGLQILGSAVATFSNTLLSKATEKLMKGLFLSDLFSDNSGGNNNLLTNGENIGSFSVGIREAQQIFSDFIIPQTTQIIDYDPLSDFIACPNSANIIKNINNCVLDNSFASAIRLANIGKPITIKEAMDQGYLTNKPLISSKDNRNKQDDCYTKGYCYNNLVKLRRARIIPVGFELAVEVSKTIGGSYTLKDAVDNFKNCNDKGLNDNQHPFCHLIDPSWILKLPQTICNAKGYGETLLSRDTSLRSEVCIDDQSCLLEDEKGTCIGGYGYCTKEKNTWKISADTCNEQYNSCTTYNNRTKQVVSYLKNTVEYDSCTANNVGCRAYSTGKDLNNSWSLDIGKSIYFNKDLEVCEAENAGCTALIPKAGLRQNLLPNSSFENIGSTNNIIDWDQSSTIILGSAQDAYDGSVSVTPSPTFISLNRDRLVKLNLNTTYTLSGYVKRKSVASLDGDISIILYTNPTQVDSILDLGTAGLLTDCTITDLLSARFTSNVNNNLDQFTRFSCSFLTPSTQPLYGEVILSGSNYWFDAIQLEEGNITDYLNTNSYADAVPTYIKVAPNGIDCAINSSDPSCNNYAPVCKEEEVGCSLFTPNNGAPSISGIVSVTDLCPQECVGYDSYKPDKTLFDDSSSSSILPFEYFIPSTAKVCNASSVGCSEFTNLDTESREYFNFLRQCEKPGPGQAVFYVWESFETGPQLKSYTLKTGSKQVGEVGNVPDYITGFTNYNACAKQIFDLPITDPNYNPDCTEFINETGDSSYRLLSKTIVVTEECSQYRKTNSTQNECQATGGVWNNANQLCVYLGYKAESNSCAVQDNGCRAYSGGGSSNLKIIFQDDFESITTDGWNAGINSTESLGRSGHSLRSPASTLGSSMIGKSVADNISINNTYLLSFWLKASTGGNQELILDTFNFTADIKSGSDRITPSGVWEKYELGPITVTSVGINPELRLRLQGGSVFFIDNIVFKEVNDKLYLVEDSWNTPNTCNQTVVGQFLPQAMLGCREYKDQDDDTRYLKSFGSLCREEAVGCKSFIDTYNSSSQSNQIYNLLCVLNNTNGGSCQYDKEDVCEVEVGRSFCRFKVEDKNIFNVALGLKQSDYSSLDAFESTLRALAVSGSIVVKDESTIEVPADKQIYIVDDGTKSCQPIEAGCYEFGKGNLYTGNNKSEVYYKNIPDQYPQLLCGAEAQGCESWTSKNAIDYFKVPRTECVYQEPSMGKIGGWFKKDKTSEPCYPTYVKNNTQELWFNADNNYNGSVGLCPQIQNGCTEFVDPQDLSELHLDGKYYYLIDNNKLQELESKCNGLISKDEGCILFDNRNEINREWSSLDTYKESDRQKKAVSPISNSTCLNGKCANDSNTIIKVTKDRYCAEWLACKTYVEGKDPISGNTKPLCLDLGLCNKQVVLNDSDNTICSNFITKNVDQGKILDINNYSGRNISWDGLEYSGYSMGNKYQIADTAVVDISDNNQQNMRLIANGGKQPVKVCRTDDTQITGNTKICPFDIVNNKYGTCTGPDFGLRECRNDNDCANLRGTYCNYLGFNIDGGLLDFKKAETVTCRAYPEQSSPFPSYLADFDVNNILKGPKQSAQEFQNAFFCVNGEQCECNYTKLTYSNDSIQKFITYGKASTGEGICQGGPKDGLDCVLSSTNEDSEEESCGKPELGGTCVKLNRQDDVLGWQGYCLERDYSTVKNADEKEAPCITWLPQDLVPGAVDIYNQYKSAGYVPPVGGGRYYCFESPGRNNKVIVGGAVPGGPTTGNTILWGSGINNYEYYLYTNLSKFGLTITKKTAFSTEEMAAVYTLTNPPYYFSLGLQYKDPSAFSENIFERALARVNGSDYGAPVDNINKDEIDFISIGFDVIENSLNEFPDNTVFYITQKDTEPHDYQPGELCNADNKNFCAGNEGVGLKINHQARSVIKGNKWYFLFASGDSRENLIRNNLAEMEIKSASELCQSNNIVNTNAFVLEFNFDNLGYFQNMRVVTCRRAENALPSNGKGMSSNLNVFYHNMPGLLNIKFKVREMCRVVIDVASEKNKARTNALWANNPLNQVGNDSYSGGITASYDTPYKYNEFITPFASSASIIMPKNEIWYVHWDQRYVKNLIYAGKPWYSTGRVSFPVTENGKTTFEALLPYNNINNAKDSLYNIFGKVYNVYDWDFVTHKYVKKNCDPKVESQVCFDYPGEINRNPVIYSLDPNIKLSNGQYKLVKRNSFTINNDVGTDIVVNNKQFEAMIKFYFWADTDFMPVTAINIDWGDDSVKVNTVNSKYKNNKPVCAPDDTSSVKVCDNFGLPLVDIPCGSGDITSCPLNINNDVCYIVDNSDKDDIKSFGNSPGACEEKYFSITHVYTCDKASCVFDPKIVITDNWGNKSELAHYGGTITLRP